MNVNPFSYLIEKLKGKVDKHTNWVEATDINTVKAQGVYPLSQYNTNLPSIGSNAEWSTLYVSGNENDVMSQIFVSRGNRIFFRHCVSGAWGSWNELALKSDIRHWSSSGWVTQNTTYTFTDAELTQGSFLVTVNGYDAYAAGLVLAQRFNNGQTNIFSLNGATHFSVSFNSDNQLTVSLELAQGVIEVQKL